jgi:hypothetical protein
MSEVGERVGVILGTEEKVIQFLGYGTYEGSFVPPPGVEIFGVDLNKGKITNPRLKLDNGDIVWGCQVWWGREEHIKNHLEEYRNQGYVVENVRYGDIHPIGPPTGERCEHG